MMTAVPHDTRALVEGDYTFMVHWEPDETDGPQFLAEYTDDHSKPPFYDRWARVLVMKCGHSLEEYEAYDLNGKPCAYDPESEVLWKDSRSFRYISNFPDPTEKDACLAVTKRREAFNRGDWRMVGCVVDVVKTGSQLTISDQYEFALWGIEDDSDASYFEEIEEDLLAQARDKYVPKPVFPLGPEGDGVIQVGDGH